MQKLGEQIEGDPTVRGGPRRWLLGVTVAVAVGTAYFLAAQLGLALLTTDERVAVFWPASGIAAGALVALGRWARVPVAVAVISSSVAAALMSDRNVWSALAFGSCNAGEALLVMWLIERWYGPTFNVDGLRRVLGFFAATTVATAIAALAASGAMKLFGPSTASFLDVWEVWFASDALGVITVAPLLIGLAAAVREPPSWREVLEGTFAIIAVSVANGLALALLTGSWSLMAPAAFLFPCCSGSARVAARSSLPGRYSRSVPPSSGRQPTRLAAMVTRASRSQTACSLPKWRCSEPHWPHSLSQLCLPSGADTRQS